MVLLRRLYHLSDSFHRCKVDQQERSNNGLDKRFVQVNVSIRNLYDEVVVVRKPSCICHEGERTNGFIIF